MNCPHCAALKSDCHCPHGVPSCEEASEGCLECQYAADEALDLVELLAHCDHAGAIKRGSTWCDQCGALEVLNPGGMAKPPIWKLPELGCRAINVNLVMHPDGAPSRVLPAVDAVDSDPKKRH